MLNLLVDGYNLLYFLEKGQIRSLEDRRESLLWKLHDYQVAKQVNITVVFDSSFNNPLLLNRDRMGALEIVYTDSQMTADDWIRNACEQRPGYFIVISNDREVVASGEANGSMVISCEEFSRKLDAVEKAKIVNPYLEDKEEDLPLYPRISTKKKGVSKKLPKRERRKQNWLKNL